MQNEDHILPEQNSSLWQVVSRHGEHISTLREDLSSLRATVTAGFDQLVGTLGHLEAHQKEILQIVHRPPEKADFKGWMAVAIPFAFLIGALLMSVISPIRDDVRNVQRVQQERDVVISDFYQFRGSVEQRDMALHDRVNELKAEQQKINDELVSAQERISRFDGWGEQLEKRLEDVDRYGSRKWVGRGGKGHEE